MCRILPSVLSSLVTWPGLNCGGTTTTQNPQAMVRVPWCHENAIHLAACWRSLAGDQGECCSKTDLKVAAANKAGHSCPSLAKQRRCETSENAMNHTSSRHCPPRALICQAPYKCQRLDSPPMAFSESTLPWCATAAVAAATSEAPIALSLSNPKERCCPVEGLNDRLV